MEQMHRAMQPIAPLMIEHRVIERMVGLVKIELDRIGAYDRVDPELIDDAVTFMKEYSDICHHGKEEKILFAELSKKPLTREHKKAMEDLIQDHIFIRGIVNSLVRAKENYELARPGGKAEVISCLNSIAEFYPRHIEKEDKHFFMPVMEYFQDGEKEAMLATFREFDSRLFHDEYRMMVSGMEERWHLPPE